MTDASSFPVLEIPPVATDRTRSERRSRLLNWESYTVQQRERKACFPLLRSMSAAKRNSTLILTRALITVIVRDRLTLFCFDRFFSGAGERSFGDYLDLVVFADGAVRFWFCWFCTHMDASTSHRFCVRMRGFQEPYLFAEAALEKGRSYCLDHRLAIKRHKSKLRSFRRD
jgi:hypothetical protein